MIGPIYAMQSLTTIFFLFAKPGKGGYIFLAGCGGKPAWQNKNRMSSYLGFADFAARLREFVRFSVAESPDPGAPDPRQDDGTFDLLARELCSLQFEHNLPYRQFCAARSVSPASVDRWWQIPAIPTVAFKELELSCLPPSQRSRVFHSSGTTAERPSRHFHNTASLAIYEASLLPWFQAHLLAGRLEPWPVICLAPPASAVPKSSLAYMFRAVCDRFGSPGSAFVGTVTPEGGWELDTEAALNALRGAVRKDQPVIILGTAFSLVHLIDGLAARRLNFELPLGSCVMETGGYKGRSRAMSREQLYSLISSRLGIPAAHIVSEYGMSELSSQAYDHQAASAAGSSVLRAFRFPPWVRIQVISPETGLDVAPGETGLLRIFDLANVYSVMAIQTEDLATLCGRGFALLGRAPQAEPRGCSLLAQ